MIRLTSLLLLCFISTQVYAQQQKALLERLKQYDFETAFLTTTLKDADAEHSCNLTTTIASEKDTTVEQIKFDPTMEIGSRWQLVSVNNSAPSEDDLAEFDYTHNTKGKKVNAKVDEQTLKLHQEDDDYLVVEFRYEKNSLPHKVKFLKDCTGYAYINKKSKKLEMAKFQNTEQLRLRSLRINRLKMTVNYEFLEKDGVYHITDETLEMGTYYHGSIIDLTIDNHYTDYKKIN